MIIDNGQRWALAATNLYFSSMLNVRILVPFKYIESHGSNMRYGTATTLYSCHQGDNMRVKLAGSRILTGHVEESERHITTSRPVSETICLKLREWGPAKKVFVIRPSVASPFAARIP